MTKSVAMKKSEGKWPAVAIVIVNYNGASSVFGTKPLFMSTLKSLEKIRYPNFKVVVTDDSSTDNSIEYLNKKFPKIETVVSRPNGGFARAANYGMRYAIKKHSPDYLLLICNGIIVTDPEWLSKMVSVGESDAKIGIVGCKLFYPGGELQDTGFKMVGPAARSRARNLSDSEKSRKGAYSEVEEVAALSVVQLIKRQVIDKVGFHDDTYYMGSDDVDYCLVAGRAGFRMMYDGETSAIHIENVALNHTVTYEKKDKDHWFPILQTNAMYFAFKNFKTLGRIEWMSSLILASFVGIGMRQMKLTNLRLKTRIPWRLKMTLKGIVTGYRLYKHKISKEEAYNLKH